MVLVFQLIPVKIDDGEAQIIISPNQITVLDTKGREYGRIEIDPKIGMAGVGQKGFEIDNLFHAIIKGEAQAVIARRFGGDDVDGGLAHWSLPVMRSGLMDLCRMKKSIYFWTISLARTLTSS